MRLFPVLCSTLLMATGGGASAQTPAGRAITYQGKLTSAGLPAAGPHDVRFRVMNDAAAGAQVGVSVCVDGVVPSADGSFTASGLDFGAFADGSARWIEVSVRADAVAGNCGAGVYTTLTPRQRLDAAPYALGVVLPLAETQVVDGFETAAFSITNNSAQNATYAIRGQTGAVNDDAAGVFGIASGTAQRVIGVKGFTSSTEGYGVAGYAGNSTALSAGIGVFALSSAPRGSGVFAHANSTAGDAHHGVQAWANGPAGIGVEGQAYAASGATTGVIGRAQSTTGTGVRGVAGAATGVSFGVRGQSASPDGYAGYFDQRVFIGGELTHKFTAAGPEERMTPVAYGNVNAAGTTVLGTSNLSVSTAGGIYLIAIAGENYHFQQYMTVVTPATSSTPVLATTSSGSGQLQVRLFTLAGALTTGQFHFVVYKR